ncbi:hypothetical protein GCM10023322_48850 [Rugosimonospora acidiphila]|uniref:Uncharacterized protein n=1 Tax=Rugosimonospora acidiphila TaxID=556531 RepID=A0ABP9S7A5_9ACTN
MMAQARLRLLRLGDWRSTRIATFTAGLAVAAAWVPTVLLEPWTRSFLDIYSRYDAVLAALAVSLIVGFTGACLFNRCAMVVAFAAVRRRRAIVLAAVLGAFTAAMATCELAGAGAIAERCVVWATIGSCVLTFLILSVWDSRTMWLNFGAILGLMIPLVAWSVARREHHLPPLTAALSVAAQSLFALAVGTSCAWLVLRWTHGLPPRWRWLRVPAAAAVAAYPLFLLLANQLLGGIDEVALLPIMATLVVLAWRAMARGGRLAVRAAADAVGALGLGVVAVLTLAWLANVLDLPRTEVDAVKGVAARLRDVIDLPWWLWALVYAALTGAQLALAFGPRWATRMRSGVRRVTAGVRLGARTGSITGTVLMFAAFLVALAPVAVTPVLAHRMRAHYTASLSAQAAAEREQAISQAVTRAFSVPNPPDVPVLRAMLADIHTIDHPHRAGDGPTGTEAALIRQLGQLQGQARQKAPHAAGSDAAPDTAPPHPDAAAGFAGTPSDAADLSRRLTTVQDQDERTDQRREAADEAADLAASTLTTVLDSVPLPFGIDRFEVVGLVRGYLEGLAESPIGEAFQRWTQLAAGGTDPPAGSTTDATALVEPNAQLLEFQASLLYFQTRLDTKAGASTTADDRVRQETQQNPLLAAVDMANQTRFLRTGAGVCVGCNHPGDLYHRFEDPGLEVRPEFIR